MPRPHIQWSREIGELEKNLPVCSKRSSLIAASSTTHRGVATDNQDSAAVARSERSGIGAVIVADGLGSHAYAGYGATWAVDAASQCIHASSVFTEKEFHEVFTHARERVRELASTFCTERGITVDKDQSFGTTLLLAAETDTSLMLGYVGNGAIWHLRGNFNDFSESIYVPWNALNYLNPHSIQDGSGNEALYRLVSISDDTNQSMPTILKLQKDEEFGDIIVICTDGVCSNDRPNQIGRYRDGSIWLHAAPLVLRCFEWLRKFFAAEGVWSDAELSAALNALLLEFRTEGLLDDDASVGMIITGVTLDYQAGKLNRGLVK